MHPVLFHVGSYTVTSYGAALILAFAAGIWLARRRAVDRGLDPWRVLDVCMVIVVTSLLGARLFYVVTHVPEFTPPRGAWSDAVNPFHSGGVGIVGLSMMGGVALAVAAALGAMRWRDLPVLATADVLAPPVALGEGITRIGCFLNGCCHGLVCEWPWAVHFPDGSPAAAIFPGQAVHPTQLYTSVGAFAVFALLSWVDRRKPSDGTTFFAFLVLLPGLRIALDFVRYYEEQVILFRLGGDGVAFTFNQAICAALVAAGVLGLVLRRRRQPVPA